jgi:hypothetical protein
VETVLFVPTRYQCGIQDGLSKKRVTQKGAFGIGMTVGTCAVLLFLAIGFLTYKLSLPATLDTLKSPPVWFWAVVLTEVFIVAASPAVGMAWLWQRAMAASSNDAQGE